jgi:excisionase family DNA binding protein
MSKFKATEEVMSGEAVEPLLTYQRVAEILGVTDRTVWELVRKGELRKVRVGRSVRVDPADLRQFIEDSKSS